MTAPLSFSDAAAVRAAFADNDDGPLVVIDLRPPCASERIEISGGFDGPDPIHVVKSLCRALECGPGAITAVIDPTARGLRGDAARCYVLDKADRRVARITGLSFAYVNVTASALASRGWRPGMNREAGLRPDGVQ